MVSWMFQKVWSRQESLLEKNRLELELVLNPNELSQSGSFGTHLRDCLQQAGSHCLRWHELGDSGGPTLPWALEATGGVGVLLDCRGKSLEC